MDTFILRVLLSTVVVSLLILIIVLMKKVFFKHISVQMHYKMWYLLFVPLVATLVPWKWSGVVEQLSQYVKRLFAVNQTIPLNGEKLSEGSVSAQTNTNLLHDFAVSVNKSTPAFVHHLFFNVWILGIMFLIGMFIFASYRIHQLKKSAISIEDPKINAMLQTCKEIIGIKKKIKLRETSLISSPIILGIFRPYILLPKETRQLFTVSDLKYVFLHELSHQKNKDVLVNYGLWIVRMVYWFNPLVWYAFKKIKMDRELACDALVLKHLHGEGYIEYGHTIIRFANKQYNRSYEQFVPGIGGTKTQIKRRIQHIANYSKESPLLKWKSIVICSLLGVIVLILSPITAVIAGSDDVYQFNEKNVVDENLDSYFKDYKGSFVLYDSSTKQYHIYNDEMSKQRISPDSTYKIYSALFALEANVISPTHSKIDWDGTLNPFHEWNKNHNLSTAMSNSVNWYFQHLDQELGKNQLQYYFDKIDYGNKNLSSRVDQYWMESSLKISPIEQVELLQALNENKFGFRKKNIESVKKAIFINAQEDGKLFGKTGTGAINGKDVNGWFVGFVEKADRTYYFAINIQHEHGHASGKKAAQIANKILNDKHIY